VINRDSAQNLPIGYRVESDTWRLATPIRKVEFELFHLVGQ